MILFIVWKNSPKSSVRHSKAKNYFTVLKNKPGPAQVGAPYPRLKNSKRTSKCQFTVLENRKTKKNGSSGAPGPDTASPWRAKRGDTSEIVNIFVAVEGGTLWGKNFPKKSLAVPKKIESMVCYAGKQEKPFWFSSLG